MVWGDLEVLAVVWGDLEVLAVVCGLFPCSLAEDAGGGMKDKAGFPTDLRLYEMAFIPIFCASVACVVLTGGRGDVLEGRTELTIISDTSLDASTPVSSMLVSNNSLSESLILKDLRANTLKSSGWSLEAVGVVVAAAAERSAAGVLSVTTGRLSCTRSCCSAVVSVLLSIISRTAEGDTSLASLRRGRDPCKLAFLVISLTATGVGVSFTGTSFFGVFQRRIQVL